MGGTTYNVSDRSTRAIASSYFTASVDDIFTQNREGKAHKSMKSQGVTLREARDSEVHPNSIPIIIALDVTGSMGHIPHELIKDGLPDLISGIIQNGIPDPALLFLAIGDHEVDREPLQIAQFESGDEELDMWLTRTYIESGGGGNEGESYGLAHYFAARHCQTDHWDKRSEKGFLITIGDEPNLRNYPNTALKEVMGSGDISTFTDAEILVEAQEKWHVYHIMPAKETRGARNYWDQLLGENSLWVEVDKIAQAIKDIVCKHTACGVPIPQEEPQRAEDVPEASPEGDDSGVML